MNIIEENQHPVNEEGLYITEEEYNYEVDNTDIENNEDDNIMNETNYGISVTKENDLGKDAIISEDCGQSDESEECDQSMERPRRPDFGKSVDRPEISFDGKTYL